MLCEPSVISTEDASLTFVRYFQATNWKNFRVFLAKYMQIHCLSKAYFKNTLLPPHQILVASGVLSHAGGQRSVLRSQHGEVTSFLILTFKL